MKYIAYDQLSGNIKYFYELPVSIAEAPDGLNLLEIFGDYRANIVDTYKVVDQKLVLINSTGG
jgi:hypothetical protein